MSSPGLLLRKSNLKTSPVTPYSPQLTHSLVTSHIPLARHCSTLSVLRGSPQITWVVVSLTFSEMTNPPSFLTTDITTSCSLMI
ncbi:hypothetical protein DPMN_085363 [Dreissena polymorpha]|uniref:Uncharacterized protein n=1 Tax=Dreissena polymorpha TaxID=45954 RepID=A0A9D4BLU2_DREPO|nr:hypothetical protein DPMN_085363 [Dreissena polymorpha]